MAVKGIVEPVIEEADVYAFRALAEGLASADQQRRVGNWLLSEGARVMADPFTEIRTGGGAGTESEIAFAMGRRYVGILMREMLLPKVLERGKVTTTKLHPKPDEGSQRKPTLTERRSARGTQ